LEVSGFFNSEPWAHEYINDHTGNVRAGYNKR